jgi:hypothetical protein
VTRRSFWYVVIAMGVAGVLLLQFALLAKMSDQTDAIRGTQQKNAPAVIAAQDAAKRAAEAAEAAAMVGDQINDCLNKGGACYHAARQQHETDRWIQVLSAACAVGFADLPLNERTARTWHCVLTHTRGITSLGVPPRR